jgi:hypothetical protein
MKSSDWAPLKFVARQIEDILYGLENFGELEPTPERIAALKASESVQSHIKDMIEIWEDGHGVLSSKNRIVAVEELLMDVKVLKPFLLEVVAELYRLHTIFRGIRKGSYRLARPTTDHMGYHVYSSDSFMAHIWIAMVQGKAVITLHRFGFTRFELSSPKTTPKLIADAMFTP